MAQYSIPGQNNLTFTIPDEGQIFAGVGDKITENNPIYKRVGNTIVHLAQGTSEFDKVYGAGAFDKIARYNLGDVASAFNGISPGFNFYNTQAADISQFNPSGPVTPGTSFTQQMSSVNPNSYDLKDSNGNAVYTAKPVSANEVQYSAPTPTHPAQTTNAGAVLPTNDPSGMSTAQSQAINTAASGGAPVQQAQPSTPQGGAGFATALQPGNTGPEVQKLQDFLVSQGLMSQNDLAGGGYGTYGPKTTAAVAALQQRLGVDNSSGVGFFGPKTIAALQSSGQQGAPTSAGGANSTAQTGQPQPISTDTGNTPDQNLQSAYMNILQTNGSGDFKALGQKFLDEQRKLTDNMNSEIANVRNDPWLSQSEVERRVQKIQNSFETKLNTASNFAALYENLYKDSIADAQFRVGLIEADQKAAIARAQAKQDALDALGKYHDFVEAGGRKLLVDKKTGKVIADLGAANVGGSGGTMTGKYSKDQDKYIDQINNGVSNNLAYKTVSNARTFADGVLTSLAQKTGLGDIAAINQFQKVIDEGAVTRDQDVRLVQQSQSLVNTLKTQVKRLEAGDQLSEDSRNQMRTVVQQLYDAKVRALSDNPYIKAQIIKASQNGIDSNDTILGQLGSFGDIGGGAPERYNPGTILIDDEAHIQYMIGADGVTKIPIASTL